jgi:hypothetical protein
MFASGEIQPWALEDVCNVEVEVNDNRLKQDGTELEKRLS